MTMMTERGKKKKRKDTTTATKLSDHRSLTKQRGGEKRKGRAGRRKRKKKRVKEDERWGGLQDSPSGLADQENRNHLAWESPCCCCCYCLSFHCCRCCCYFVHRFAGSSWHFSGVSQTTASLLFVVCRCRRACVFQEKRSRVCSDRRWTAAKRKNDEVRVFRARLDTTR